MLPQMKPEEMFLRPEPASSDSYQGDSSIDISFHDGRYRRRNDGWMGTDENDTLMTTGAVEGTAAGWGFV